MIRFNRPAAQAVAAIGCALMVGLAGCAMGPKGAAPASGDAAQVASKGVCIETYRIDHTEVTDDNTILFHMIGGKIWKNTLTARCVGLKASGGFKYETDIDRICSNLQTIRVIEQGGGPLFGSTCLLGEFTPYTPPPKAN